MKLGCVQQFMEIYNDHSLETVIMPRPGGIKRLLSDVCLSDVCLSRTSGLSRERLYTPSSIVTLISIVHVYVLVKSFYFSMFQLLLSVHVSI